MKTLIRIVLLISIIALTQYALAQGYGMQKGRGMGRNMPTFAEFDLDKSGYLDEEEFIEARGRRVSERAKEGRMMRGLSSMMQFADIDMDGNGKVSPEEFSQGQALHRQQKMR